MLVAEAMQSDVVTVRPDDTVARAVVVLADAHVSGVAVVDSRGRLAGALSSSDLLIAEAEASSPEARERLFRDTPVEEIMTRNPLTISPEATVKEAARQMLYADVHRLFVLLDDRLVGVISRSDAAQVLATSR